MERAQSTLLRPNRAPLDAEAVHLRDIQMDGRVSVAGPPLLLRESGGRPSYRAVDLSSYLWERACHPLVEPPPVLSGNDSMKPPEPLGEWRDRIWEF